MAKGLLAVGASSAARTIDAVLKLVTSTEPTAIEIMVLWWRTVCSPRCKKYYVTIWQRRLTIQERIKIDDKRSTPAFPTKRIELCELRYSSLLVKARIYFLFRGYSSAKNSARIRAALSRLRANELTKVLQVLIREHTPSTRPS